MAAVTSDASPPGPAASPAVRVDVSDDGVVWTVVLRRPRARNAVDRATAKELTAAFRRFDADPRACVAVLTGSEDAGTFCAGADLKAIAAGDLNEFGPVGSTDGPMGPTRLQLTKPVIAAISGHAVAGGACLNPCGVR